MLNLFELALIKQYKEFWDYRDPNNHILTSIEGTTMRTLSEKKNQSRPYTWLIWPLVAGFAVVVALQMQQSANSSSLTPASVPAGNLAPQFTLTDISGNKVALSDFKGKVVILDFWATWCPPCKREIPDFISLQSAYEARGLQIVGIALDQPDKVREFARQNGMNYPVLLGNDQIAQEYGGIEGIPTTFIIDRNGRLVNRFEGFRSREDFESEIRRVL